MAGIWEATQLSRRAAVIGLGAGGMSAAVAGGRLWALAAQAGMPTASTPVPITGLTFVGEVSTPGQGGASAPHPDEELLLVAVVVADAAPGEDRRQARAYLCGGTDISEWFDQGAAAAETIDLTSANGSTLRATLSDEAVSGTATLADGRSFVFTAAPAHGIAGLYNVTVSADGQIRGSSEAGGRIEGEIRAAAPAVNDRVPFVVSVTTPEREGSVLEMRLTALAPNIPGPTDQRWIVLPDARITGASRESVGPVGIRITICFQ